MSQGYQPLMSEHHRPALELLCTRLSIVNIVETGTGPASSGLAFADHFGLKGYSCDVSGECVENARQRHPTAHVHHGESLAFFKTILPTLEGPTFFWLDGHCPTDQRDLPGPVFPPYEEMQLIKSLKKGYEKDAMWLDDIAMITAPDNPDAGIWGGYLGATGKYFYGEDRHLWADYLAIFEDTHRYRSWNGVLEVEPL